MKRLARLLRAIADVLDPQSAPGARLFGPSEGPALRPPELPAIGSPGPAGDVWWLRKRGPEWRDGVWEIGGSGGLYL
ncbi:MAG: hypothetical protein V3S03_03295 [Vicinamibacteria bacterium]